MFNITQGSVSQFWFGFQDGVSGCGGPTARSDPCVFAAVRRPIGRWRRGFFVDDGSLVENRKGVSMTSETGRRWPGIKREEPRTSVETAAAPRPNEQQLGTVAFKDTETERGLQTATGMTSIWTEERLVDPEKSRIEGWVACAPVVDGVADSGWRKCKGGRVRLVVQVKSCPEQQDWVRAMAHGGAYAKEVLGHGV